MHVTATSARACSRAEAGYISTTHTTSHLQHSRGRCSDKSAMEASLMESSGVAREPDWLTGNLEGYPAAPEIPLSVASKKTGEQEVVLPLQQSDLLKPLLMDIARHGLSYAYDKFSGEEPAVSGSGVKQTERPRDVIVVGAGLAGMAAAYELKRVGHNVTILEAQDRVGGRIRTYDEDDGFAEGLHVDGGLSCSQSLLSRAG